jgi:hypothetical protein
VLYRLLGMAVWRGGKWFLRRRYAVARTPKPLLAGALAAVVAAAVLAARGRGGGG